MFQKISPVPVNYFAMVLGLSGLGLAWRYGASAGLLPKLPGEVLQLASGLLWLYLLGAYIFKWVYHRPQAQEEFFHTIQCCFISLIPIATLLVGMSLMPYISTLGWLLLLAGIVGQLAFAAYRSAGLWRGTHVAEATTPIIYLPTVATNFVTASALGATGHTEFAMIFFGAGMLSWVGLEAVILQRLRTLSALPAPLRPVIGIQLAPPFVGCSAYLAVTGGPVDSFALALIGYGILQGLFLLRLFPWVREGGFSPSFWAFSFGLSSMAGCGLRLAFQYAHRDVAVLGWAMFIVGTGCILLLLVKTIRLFYPLFRRATA